MVGPRQVPAHFTPAFWLNSKRSTEGQWRSLSSLSGDDPDGPSARLSTSKAEGSVDSTISGKVK